jgi:hypothetical protein
MRFIAGMYEVPDDERRPPPAHRCLKQFTIDCFRGYRQCPPTTRVRPGLRLDMSS